MDATFQPEFDRFAEWINEQQKLISAAMDSMTGSEALIQEARLRAMEITMIVLTEYQLSAEAVEAGSALKKMKQANTASLVHWIQRQQRIALVGMRDTAEGEFLAHAGRFQALAAADAVVNSFLAKKLGLSNK